MSDSARLSCVQQSSVLPLAVVLLGSNAPNGSEATTTPAWCNVAEGDDEAEAILLEFLLNLQTQADHHLAHPPDTYPDFLNVACLHLACHSYLEYNSMYE